ncbi:FERM and PDZ domain-containing protein 4 [Trichonephila clavipes]|nr:FERM and PDZ domain-containing protein 4 [Trichonephila clavipes]
MPATLPTSSVDHGHETKISSWLPPVESWDSGGTGLPYGWEAAIDKDGKTYYINHTNRTTTYESPRKEGEEEIPQPREVQLVRDAQMGFGFVAGSEKPVIVRFVTEGGPNEHKLQPGDQIMKINGEDVMKSPREHVIELIRSCKQTVTLLVCQPQTNNTTRKSALLTAAKKAKLRNNPSRVRFSEGVIINGSPLYSPSPVDGNVPFLPNVLKVFLENGQTKSFKYDSTTTVQDVLNSLFEKLSIKCVNHFCLATEHVKITRKNRLTILDPKDTLTKIAAKPGAHHLRCVLRVTYVPKDAYDLLQKDPIAFEYLYLQCCNDVVEERFTPELKYDIALRLTALNMQQHCLSNGIQGKVTVKMVERECGLERFVPVSLLETMKLKELRKLLGHFLKQNQSLCAPGQKHLTPLQAKLHYLKIISELPSYGSKCFATNISVRNFLNDLPPYNFYLKS